MRCPHCGNEDKRLMSQVGSGLYNYYHCEVCSKDFQIKDEQNETS